MKLYMDTSCHLVMGLLNSDFEWVDYQHIIDKKAARALHLCLYEMLEKYDLKLKDIESTIHAAGPGSYTGIRLSEGIIQILNNLKIPNHSFYHFEVPQLLKIEKGVWMSWAFKGEYFMHTWKNMEDDYRLEKVEEYQFDAVNTYFTHFKDELTLPQNIEMIETSQLIHNHSTDFFRLVTKENLQRKPYYYRSLEEEFIPSFH